MNHPKKPKALQRINERWNKVQSELTSVQQFEFKMILTIILFITFVICFIGFGAVFIGEDNIIMKFNDWFNWFGRN